MKLLSVRLNNVRRFTQPVELANIGPGLNVFAAPNEQGKSTLFDALHALFFFDARSWKKKEAAALAPYAGGNPEISAEIEVDGQRYRVSKVFSSKPAQKQVTIHRGDVLFKQAEEAEAWISALIKAPADGGPAGLLWVRQGLTTLPTGKEDETLAARRDLLSSVAGEIEDITGGRQMERLRAALREELSAYLTDTGNVRKNGALWQANQRAAALQEQQNELQEKASAFAEMLERRRELRREETALTAPEATATRESALQQAQTALRGAQAYQERLERASEAEKTAQLRHDNHSQKLKTAQEQLVEYNAAEKALGLITTNLTQTRAQQATAQKQLDHAQASENAAHERQIAAQTNRDNALAAKAAQEAALHRKELAQRLHKAQDFARKAAKARAEIAQTPTEKQTAAVETAWRTLQSLQSAREAAAAAVTLLPEASEAAAKVRLNGATLEPHQRVALPDGGDISVDGVGIVRVHPADSHDTATLAKAQTAFQNALTACQSPSLQQARAREAHRKTAQDALRDAQANLSILAPEGVEALEAQLASLPEAADAPPEALPETQATYEKAQSSLEKARQALESARTVLEAEKREAHALQARHDEAGNRLERAAQLVGDPHLKARELDTLRTQATNLAQDVEATQAQMRTLRADAPDLVQAQVTAQRAQSVWDEAERRLGEIARDLARLEALIARDADLAVEEKLLETQGQHEAAQRFAQQVAHEVKILERLDSALAQAQQQAHDAYIGPIHAELRPLLRMVLPGADLQLDAESVLPTGLTRPQGDDGYEQLSGGTQEQIALLVRLAFARLLAKAGTPAPVILDDAIVYTDDDRIERMFNALTQQAGDMQIIVFSCRQQVFRSLGGNTLSLQEVPTQSPTP